MSTREMVAKSMTLPKIKSMFSIGSVWEVHRTGHRRYNGIGTVVETSPNLILATTEYPEGLVFVWPKRPQVIQAREGYFRYGYPNRLAMMGLGPNILVRQDAA